MKKCKRWIAVLLVTLMCLSLCGCQRLDDMRAAHAVWQEDGTILWNGNVYRMLLNPPEKLEVYGGGTVYITEADVPVLLSETLGEYGVASKDGVLLRAYNAVIGGQASYCREDMYEEIVAYLEATVEEKEMNQYFYHYWSFDTEEQEYYYFTLDQQQAMDELMTTLTFEPMPQDFYDAYDEQYFSVSIGKCDEKHLFVNDYMLEIIYHGGKYYLSNVAEGGYIAEVPAEYDLVIGDILKVYYSEFYGSDEPPHIVVK